MRCSVIIPTYNRLELLRATLNSVFAQDVPVDEVIVIDDGSLDGTREFLESLGDQVRWLGQENCGPGAARNRGIEIARGEWIAFLDSDDLWFPWSWRRYSQVIAASGASLVFGSPFRFSDEDAISQIAEPKGDPHWHGFRDYYASGDEWRWWGVSSFVMKRHAVGDIRFDERKINGEDADFLMKIGAELPVAQVDGDPTFCYREHSGSVMLDFSKTLAGARNLVESELAGVYPGGVERARERWRILGRHLRPVILELLGGGGKAEGWRLFRETLSWHLAERRWKFILAVTGKWILK
jgi:glycosyltransferase involved in cell wall biosynthesis